MSGAFLIDFVFRFSKMLVKRIGELNDESGEKWFLFRINDADIKNASDLGIPFEIYFQYRLNKEISKVISFDTPAMGQMNWCIFDKENTVVYNRNGLERIDYEPKLIVNRIAREIAPDRYENTGVKLLPIWLQNGGLLIRIFESARLSKEFTFDKFPSREELLKELDPKTPPNECKLRWVYEGL